jgi:hypothetical protein
LYEEELLRNPYTLKLWWRYLEARKGAESRRRYLLYERAVKSLPGSYKVRRRCLGTSCGGVSWLRQTSMAWAWAAEALESYRVVRQRGSSRWGGHGRRAETIWGCLTGRAGRMTTVWRASDVDGKRGSANPRHLPLGVVVERGSTPSASQLDVPLRPHLKAIGAN